MKRITLLIAIVLSCALGSMGANWFQAGTRWYYYGVEWYYASVVDEFKFMGEFRGTAQLENGYTYARYYRFTDDDPVGHIEAYVREEEGKIYVVYAHMRDNSLPTFDWEDDLDGEIVGKHYENNGVRERLIYDFGTEGEGIVSYFPDLLGYETPVEGVVYVDGIECRYFDYPGFRYIESIGVDGKGNMGTGDLVTPLKYHTDGIGWVSWSLDHVERDGEVIYQSQTAGVSATKVDKSTRVRVVNGAIEVAAGQSGMLTVTDMNGRTLQRVDVTDGISLPTAGWQPGVYIAKFAAGNEVTTRKIFVAE